LTDQAIRVVPAGWYEDPASPAHVRWWNGLAWTEHTAVKPAEQPRPQFDVRAADYRPEYRQAFGQAAAQSTASQDAVAQAAAALAAQNAETAARIAEARELERQYGISTAEHDIIVGRAHASTGEQTIIDAASSTGAEYDPNAYGTANYRGWEDDGVDADDARGTATASAWFIALWPVFTLVAIAAAAYVYFFVTPEPAIAGIPVVAAVALVPYLLTIVWAVTDARKLRRLGHEPVSPALALLGPLVYLIARRTRVKGAGPLVTLIVLTLVAVGAPVAAVATGATIPVTKALEIQQTIRADLVDSGRLATLSCPIFVESVAQGELYTCDGTLPDGSDKLVWVSIDTADGQFSYALDVK
jgi:hypothetical protein